VAAADNNDIVWCAHHRLAETGPFYLSPNLRSKPQEGGVFHVKQ
jgi:hypothetical protein